MEAKANELIEKRRQIENENRNIRTRKTVCRANIKKLEKQIEIEQFALQRYDEIINENNHKFYEAGNELEQLTGDKRVAP